LLFPTTVMVTLTYSVYRRERKSVVPCAMPASMVARQSAVYLGSLYWVYLPMFVYYSQIEVGNDVPFGICLWVMLITKSMGMWFAIVYWYFTAEDNTNDGDNDNDNNNDNENGKDNDNSNGNDNDEHNCDSDGTKMFTKDGSALPSTITAATDALDAVDEHGEPSILFSAIAKLKNKHNKNKKKRKTRSSNTMTDITDAESASMPIPARSTTIRGTSRRSSLTRRFSFNIFDGTASSGMFSSFVFDGDSEDEEKDMAESKLWESCQEIIKE